MLNAEVYRKAAEFIETGRGSNLYTAIIHAEITLDGTLEYDHEEEFEILFYNSVDDYNWFGNQQIQENRNHIVLALLLMAEIAESER